AFLVTTDVLEIYMQEFWATAKLHHLSIRFKMDTKKCVLDLEAFREMLHISPRIPSQSFVELPTEEEILEFLRYLGHSHEIRYLTDVNVNKLYQPWRSFASVINKCLTGKSSGIDSFRLSHAQILWGLYHRRNVDFAYLIWEDFMKPSIPRQNRINWHYVRDDVLFSTIKMVSRHQTTQQYGAILPIELTTDDIWNSMAYKEYYACATGEAAPKPKASARKKKDDSASSTTPSTPTPTTTVVSAPRLSATAKGKQPARATTTTESTDMERTEAEQLKIVLKRSRQETHISQQHGFGIDEGTDVGGQDEGDKSDESDDGSDEGSDDETVKASSDKDDDNDDDDENDEEEELAKNNDEETEYGKGGDDVNGSEGESDKKETRQEEEGSFDPIPRTPEGNDDDNDEEEELAKSDEEDKETGKGGDEVRESEGEGDEEETRQEEDENFDPILRTPEESEEDQDLRLSEEVRIQKEEDADELYRDVNINQGKGLQVTQNVEDTHVTLTP
nr:hypothetical protein [Tanacetum cinerariifolium]